MSNKPKKKVSNIMLVLICTMIILYTAAAFVLQYYTSVEISPTVTTAWYAFWGAETGFLACIKCAKVLKGTNDNDFINNTEDIQEKDAE